MPQETHVHWWSFYDEESWLRLSLNVETLEPHNSDTLEQKKKNLSVKIGPLSNMDRGYYWTDEDEALNLPEVSCSHIHYADKNIELCDHGFSGEQVESAHVYTVKNLSDDKHTTVLECRERSQLSNPLCIGRVRFLDNLQINYQYNISYFEKAIEIDQGLHDLILQFHHKS
ncbi:hypothetical protein JCM17846_28860 [Iodidimonas nitroreducens]|uniref:Uncharacterized protein n=2 Tax=Iodidimonas nitroreducens TaxID=1236968 RepID=A0A5A7NBW6_9PROT|nr:hypothetical protein JCM17846_28860 [Iodidimonas nitroreducens]